MPLLSSLNFLLLIAALIIREYFSLWKFFSSSFIYISSSISNPFYSSYTPATSTISITDTAATADSDSKFPFN